MNQKRIKEILDRFADCRLIVLGDLMLDEFIWGEVRRISPEAPVPVVEVKRESWTPGGAGNVVLNLLELGAQAIPIGITGEDWAAERLRLRLAERRAETKFLVTDASRPTTVKTRIVAHSQQMVRADREDRSPIKTNIEDSIIAAFNEALSEADAVIVSDYDKGLLTPRVLENVLNAAAERNVPVCLDPKIRNFALYKPVTVVTPNQLEAERATGIEIHNEQSLIAAAHRIREMLECQHVLITRGEHGMMLLSASNNTQESVTHIPTRAREVYDVTGAGDTVIAALALSLAAKAYIEEAADIANHAAGIVVGKVGTATTTREELSAALAEM
ncbi:MAG TPA: D-glycero-beta-D-manno-heptose-7-phosphate kinase [Blastocatellia bacterium]|nr:D-glycero-beta-D-manno-heptose-7-phosphate kinase [Blastocatellia bacterium]